MKLMIKELRIAAGLTQQELANALSIPQRTHGSYEREERTLTLKLS